MSATRTGCTSATLKYDGISGQTYRIRVSSNGTDWGTPTPDTHVSTGPGSTVSVSSGSNIRYVRIQHTTGTADSGWEQVDLGAIPTPAAVSVTVTRSATSPYNYTVTVTPDDQGFDIYYYEASENSGNFNNPPVSGTSSTSPFVFTGTGKIQQIRVRRGLCGAFSPWVVVSSWTTADGTGKLEAPEVSVKVETPATEPQKKGKQPAESKAPAAKKSAPTVEPTPTPEPSVSMAPDPEPIVTESVVVPEPVPVPTPSA